MNTIFQTNQDTRRIANFLMEQEEGKTVTFEELNEFLGKDIREHRHILNSARSIAMKENKSVFGSVRGVGLKKLNDIEKVQSGESSINQIRSVCVKSAKRVTSVIFEKLPNDIKIEHNAYLSYLGTVKMMGKKKNIELLKNKVRTSQETLPLDKMMRLYNQTGLDTT